MHGDACASKCMTLTSMHTTCTRAHTYVRTYIKQAHLLCLQCMQEVLCFTTLLDADLKSVTDTTFTVLLAKVRCAGRAAAGQVC